LPFQSWIEGANVANDADKLKELFKLEQFVNCLPKDIHKSVLERHPTSLMEAAKLADEYEVLTRPFKMDAPELSNWHNKFKGNGEWRKSQQNSSSSNDYVWQSPFRNNNSTSADHADTNSNWRRPNQNKSPPRDSNRSGGSRPTSPQASGGRTICGFCSKAGHSMARCYILHPNLRPQGGRNNDGAPDMVNLVSFGVLPASVHANECTVQNNDKAFCVYANVHSLGNDQRSICLLRDSGASRSVASQGQLHQGEYIHTGEVRLIQGIVGQPVSVPLVEILIELNGRKQWILCGLVPSLPQDISVIIGNDYSNLLPVSVGVITRGMARKQRTGELDSYAERVQARQAALNLQRSTVVDVTSRPFMQSNVFQGVSDASMSNGSVVSPTDVSHVNQVTAVASEFEGISESSVNDFDDGNNVACANSTLGLHSDELDESVDDEFVGVSDLYSNARDCAILEMLHVASNEMSTLQSNDESQIDVVGLDDGELTVLDQALCHNDTDALNDDDMGVLAVSNVVCMNDVSSSLDNHLHGAIFTSDDGDQRIVDVVCSEASGCVVNDISCAMDEVTSHVLIPSLVQLAKTVFDNLVSSGCDVRHTSSVLQVLSDTVLNAEVRDACVQVDIHDLLACHLPDTFSCFHGVLVSSVTDEMVIEQLVVKFDGQGQVGDGNILVTDSSQLVSDILVSDVIDAGTDEDAVQEVRCLFQDGCQELCLDERKGFMILTDDMIVPAVYNYLVNGLSVLMTWLCIMCRYVSLLSCLCFIWMTWIITLNADVGCSRVMLMNIEVALQDVSVMQLSGCEYVSFHEWKWWKQKSCLLSDVEIALPRCPNVVSCSCLGPVVCCHNVESMQCWHISYGAVGVFTCRKLSLDALTDRRSLDQWSRRRTFECSREWFSFQRLRWKDVVSWQSLLCSYTGTLDQVRITSSSWSLTWIFGCGLVSMYLDLEIWRLGNTFCRSLVDIPGDHQVPIFVRTLQSPCYFLCVLAWFVLMP